MTCQPSNLPELPWWGEGWDRGFAGYRQRAHGLENWYVDVEALQVPGDQCCTLSEEPGDLAVAGAGVDSDVHY